jgi:hypothetical protein
LENVQTSYISRYLALHKEFRLDREQDDLKKRLSADPRWARLRALSKLSLLPSKPLQDLQDRLGAVETCPTLQPSELKIHASCPHCGFNPITVQDIKEKASARLESIQNEFETLYRSWIEVLLANLKSDEAAHNIQAIDAGEWKNSYTLANYLNRSINDSLMVSKTHSRVWKWFLLMALSICWH